MERDEGTPEGAVRKLASLVKGIRIAMLTTVEEDGTVRSRPMATQQAEFDGTLWFFTQASSHKVTEVEAHHQVNVAYANPDDNCFVSVSGRAALVRDRAKIRELWSPLLKAWFPDGVDDPELALLRVEVEQAEYWDAPSSKMVQLAGLVKALVTGRSANDIGENRQLDLHH